MFVLGFQLDDFWKAEYAYNDQAICKNWTVTHSLQQPAQEASLPSLSQTCRKSDHYLLEVQQAKQ